MRLFSLLAIFIFTVSNAHSAADIAPIAVEKSGAGRSVLYVPGLASSGDVWDGVIAALGDKYEAHVITLAGFAGAPASDGAFFETRKDAIIEYINDNELSDITIVGHSLGGFMAMELALAAPDKIDGIIIVDSVPFLAQFFLGAQTAEQAEAPAANMQQSLIAMSDEQFAQQQARFVVTQATDKTAQETILSWSLKSDRETFARATYELLTTDLRMEIANIAAKMLVLYPWIEGSPFSAAQAAFAYQAQYAQATDAALKRIDGSHHFIMLDQEDALVANMKAFFKTLD